MQKQHTLGFIRKEKKNMVDMNDMGNTKGEAFQLTDMKRTKKVPPRLELGLLDSESNVLTARPWDLDVGNASDSSLYYLEIT
ncbi:hypothetical protein MTR_3g116630 [Medicago truncatula]|uniref:Uncharacterized protein n=1 Tax=Medicago truncatula TaxID=3880 RepID=G7J725_MEDTR|nr:hypothetical protein MTR_3g116630 [Medicago truncatula]